MTAARVRGCQRLMSNSGNDIERLEGVTGILEDWHAKVVFLVGTHMSRQLTNNTIILCAGNMATLVFSFFWI